MIRIALVDDNSLNRRTIRQVLQHNTQTKVVLEAHDGRDFLLKMKDMHISEFPNLVLIDLDMPVMGGIETIAVASTKYPDMKFLVLTVFDDDDKLFDAIRAGASGYILKDDASGILNDAINTIHHLNGAPMSPAIARKTLQLLKSVPSVSAPTMDSGMYPMDVLSEREQDVLRLLIEGKNYRVIAESLFISPQTVRKHVGNIYEKLHINSKAQAILLAHKYHWA
jgi:DNA-binding NarL/FixJ family response regulator